MFTMSISEAVSALRATNDDFVSLFKHGTLAVEYYAPHGVDDQTPHSRDEIYVISTGRGTFTCEGRTSSVGPGSVVFVRAGVAHRFEDFSADFGTWVFFYGPDGGESESKA